jgi:CheY-like chemotaxis protein/nitrogen-specific signal transduction histidine kinase
MDAQKITHIHGFFVSSLLGNVEEELRAAKQKAEASTRAKSEFLANMSHELRTPMAAILGYADILLSEEINQHERREFMKTIQRNGRHLLNVLNDLLDLSKIEAGQLYIEQIPTSVIDIVCEVESLMQVQAKTKGLFFYTSFETPIPVSIISDPTRCRQILLNLIGNAIKFTHKGEVNLTVSMKEVDRRRELWFKVRDTGPGIEKSQLHLLCEPFMQANSKTNRPHGGTGLGLSISRRLADLLGARLDIVSQPNQGSTFSLVLDVGSVAELTPLIKPEQARLKTPSSLSLSALPNFTNIKVLIAEDSIDNQRLLAFYLQRFGAEVHKSRDGHEVIKLVTHFNNKDQPFDLILMDMQMPQMDGYQAARLLREQGVTIPIVALTAHAMVGDRELCLEAGCNDYFTKPFTVNQLGQILLQYIPLSKRNASSSNSHHAESIPSDNDSKYRPYLDPERARSTYTMSERMPSDVQKDDVMQNKLALLIKDFASRLPLRVKVMEEALSEGDRDALKTEAHKLHGTAGSYGFEEISKAAASLERAIIDNARQAVLQLHLEHLNKLCHSQTTEYI